MPIFHQNLKNIKKQKKKLSKIGVIFQKNDTKMVITLKIKIGKNFVITFSFDSEHFAPFTITFWWGHFWEGGGGLHALFCDTAEVEMYIICFHNSIRWQPWWSSWSIENTRNSLCLYDVSGYTSILEYFSSWIDWIMLGGVLCFLTNCASWTFSVWMFLVEELILSEEQKKKVLVLVLT